MKNLPKILFYLLLPLTELIYNREKAVEYAYKYYKKINQNVELVVIMYTIWLLWKFLL